MPRVPRGFSGSAGGKFGIAVRGTNSLLQKIDNLGKRISFSNRDALKMALLLVEAEAVRLVSKKGGELYAVDTGTMRRSITSKMVKFTLEVAEGRVGVQVHYAIYVHEGTRFMDPKPFLTTALENKREEVAKLLGSAYRSAIEDVSKL